MPKKSSKLKSKGQIRRQQPQRPARYKYRPLQTPASIRLLQLKPGKGEEPIRCWLFEVRLDDWPSYQALSYTWGDPNDTSTIVCNEGTVTIPRNLAEGLRVLRQPDRLKILWADAVCINQKDTEERGSQVQLMWRIFSEASRVLVWLGHGQPSMIHTAFRYICTILNRERTDTLATYQWQGKDMDVSEDVFDNSNVPPNTASQSALQHLFERPYFRRGWIIQEIVLPKNAEIFWGQACINYLWLESATAFLTGYDALFQDLAQLGMAAVNQIAQFRKVLHDTLEKYPFTQILMHAVYQTFSDPRDHIYGLLGLQKICRDMAFRRPLFYPDYTVSRLECYKSAVEILLTERGDIGILSLVAHRSQIPNDSPSWVPSFDKHIGTAIRWFYYDWRASGRHRAVVSKQRHNDVDCMRLRGFRVATLGTTVPRGERDLIDVQGMLHDLRDRYDERSIAWTMTYGETVDRHSLFQASGVEGQHMEDYRNFIRLDLGGDSPHADFSAVFATNQTFGERCAESMSRYTLFETDKKLLGLCLGPAEPGDELVIFFGGNMPFVLRRVDDSPDVWKLVGVCFVHGIMQGEAVKGSRRRVERMAEDFDLI
ncbi:heterokaryon incompatibility protein [Stagonosporopsis vannaccii]|nr:heterokaryon incompatibility protein [Stagonosporopsis vannaccii]